MTDSSIDRFRDNNEKLDAELVGLLLRFRVQLGGAALAEIVRVMNSAPVGTEYGAVVRVAGAIATKPSPLATSDLSIASVNLTTSGDQQVIADPGSGLTLRIYKLYLSVDAPVTLIFRSNGNDKGSKIYLPANGGLVLDFTGDPWVICNSHEAFKINLSVNANVGVTAFYTAGA